MKKANVKIIDIKPSEAKNFWIISVEAKAEGYEFHKAFKLKTDGDKIDTDRFKKIIGQRIAQEVEFRKAVEPIRDLQKSTFKVAYSKP